MIGNQLNRIQTNRENKIKSLLFLFFKKINKINKPLEKLTKKKREASYYYKNKKGELTRILQILNRKQKNFITTLCKYILKTYIKFINSLKDTINKKRKRNRKL